MKDEKLEFANGEHKSTIPSICPPPEYFEEINDAREEVEEEMGYDNLDLLHYVLEFEIEAKWPNSVDSYSRRYKYCYPLLEIDSDEKPAFPLFEDFFSIEGVDRLHNYLEIRVYAGEEIQDIRVPLGEAILVPFDYQSSEEGSSRRVGKATFRFLKRRFDAILSKGKIEVTLKIIDEEDGILLNDEEATIDPNVTMEDDAIAPAFIENAIIYGFYMGDEEAGYYVLLGTDMSEEKETEGTYYIPIEVGKENIDCATSLMHTGLTEDRRTTSLIKTVKFICFE